METTEKVLKAMVEAGKPLKAGEIADIIGLDKKEIDNAIKKLKKEEKIVFIELYHKNDKENEDRQRILNNTESIYVIVQ